MGGAILCERRVRVQGSDMSPLRIRCMTVELSEAELILWAVTHQPAMESTCRTPISGMRDTWLDSQGDALKGAGGLTLGTREQGRR